MNKPVDVIAKQIRLRPEEVQSIEKAFTRMECSAGEEILLAGHSRVPDLYFVESGCLRLYSLDENGEAHNLQFAIEEHWISDLNAFSQESKALFGLASLEASVLWKISKSNLDHLYQEIPSLERYFRILIQNAYQQALVRTQMQLQGSATKRYQYFQSKFPYLIDRIPQYHIASFIGIKPQSLSRIKSTGN